MSNFPFCLFPNFFPCCTIMSICIQLIEILININRIWRFFNNSFCYLIIRTRIIYCHRSWANMYLCTESLQKSYFVLFCLITYSQNTLISLYNTVHCNSKPRITRSCFYNSRAFIQKSSFFCIFYNM